MAIPRPRPSILEIRPYVGGKAGIDGDVHVGKLSANECPIGPSARAIEAFRDAAAEMHRYPDGSCHRLRQAIGRRHKLDPARLACGAGSDELISLLIKAYAGAGDALAARRVLARAVQHEFVLRPPEPAHRRAALVRDMLRLIEEPEGRYL